MPAVLEYRDFILQGESPKALYSRVCEAARCTHYSLMWGYMCETQQAHRVCFHCPVRIDCLRYALWMEKDRCRNLRVEVWGGLYPADRNKLWSKYRYSGQNSFYEAFHKFTQERKEDQ